ncbi:peptide chain release factor 3 [Sphingomonas morindae]|uniref:Peptide chain release factor 3 n=1 Tax=Sphingomonas morindae TaxID=1541170 RepID=A0ABY4X4S5_9SPHN|nr:peptide chain release factor 3 [Sphingomonas morindae]USI71893.1 peptide chain release factor 3 [Sphingomonas morindae]
MSSDRRTFAIISHPDAGKTTLTEKLLLAGGAIHLAGEVRARGANRRARSDWMKIEQQRGISVTSSVMTFVRDGLTFNLLDTPGHEDFSEDTYRTLTAVDSAVMVIDAARGIEAQTRKLFEVCRLRSVPIITFINKVDREGLSPFALLDEIADKLALDVTPMNWPVGMGGTYEGLFDFGRSALFRPEQPPEQVDGLGDARLDGLVEGAQLLRDEAELALGGYGGFDEQAYRAGDQTPVFFGSALREYGVEALIDAIAAYAPPPRSQPAAPRPVLPEDPKVSGFIFKVQANMNPAHRDRIAFLRVCSGRFKRGMKLRQVQTGKTIAINSPIFFFAQDRELAETALPGDIIGIPNHGVLRVGDTLTEGETLTFTGIPNFAPEILRRVRLLDPTKTKQLRTALTDMAEEGVTQLFKPLIGSQWIVGVVGQLQLEVLISRLSAEYGVPAEFEPAPFDTARWISAEDPADLKAFMAGRGSAMAEDRDGAPVFLARDQWEVNYVAERAPEIRFSATRERAAA